MKISGLNKTTLIDYPSYVAATIFTQGCNMRCPYCHNRDLVLNNNITNIDESIILKFIKKRKNILEGICITGGEPTLNDDLLSFIEKIKSYNLKVKLDTNGLHPNVIKKALNDKLVDYIAMDIKNSRNKYTKTTLITENLLEKIDTSINLLITSNIDYEFRTTVVKELHTKEDFIKIGKWIKGAKNYYLQQYRKSPNQLTSKSFSHYKKEELFTFKEIILPYVKNVAIRES